MFSKIKELFEPVFNRSQRKFQKYIHRKEKTDYTPTYVLIAKDMNHPQEQVFEAAVYYLCKIAKAKENYRKEIVVILNAYLKNNSEKTIRCAHIQKMIQKYDF